MYNEKSLQGRFVQNVRNNLAGVTLRKKRSIKKMSENYIKNLNTCTNGNKQ